MAKGLLVFLWSYYEFTYVFKISTYVKHTKISKPEYANYVLIVFYFADCQKKDDIVAVIANITGNAKFHIQSNETDHFMDIVLYRMYQKMNEERIAMLHGLYSDIDIFELDPAYRSRFSANVTIEDAKKMDILITLSAVEVADAGVYMAEMRYPRSLRKCFTLYALGEGHKNIHLKRRAGIKFQ